MSRRSWLISALVAILVAGAAVWFVRGRRKDAPRFDTAPVERGSIISRITATGTVNALVTVQVGSQVSGRVAELKADFNSEVKKGQLVAKIDPQLFNAALEQARANFAAANANLAKSRVQALDAQRQAERSRTLRERNLIAQADQDTAQATADAAKAQVEASQSSVEQARANLHQAEVNLAYTDIYSPIDGVVISRSVDVGQTVAASLSAPTLFTIAGDLRKMQVHTSVAEADVGKLAEGMSATFRVDAYPTEEFQGVISQIRNSPQTVQNVVTYDAVIDVQNDELKLRPGMTANVTVVAARRDDVLRVPNAAMRFRPPAEVLAMIREQRTAGAQGGAGGAGGGGGGWRSAGDGGTRGGGQRTRGGGPGAGSAPADQKTVWVLRGELPTPVRFRAGVTDGSYTEVPEGELKEGDQVVTDVSDGSAPSSPSQANPLGGGAGGGMRRGGGRMF